MYSSSELNCPFFHFLYAFFIVFISLFSFFVHWLLLSSSTLLFKIKTKKWIAFLKKSYTSWFLFYPIFPLLSLLKSWAAMDVSHNLRLPLFHFFVKKLHSLIPIFQSLKSSNEVSRDSDLHELRLILFHILWM